MHKGHFITRCKKCNGIINQCRCMKENKMTTWEICDKCINENKEEKENGL
jgi:hypothetical protein